MALSQQESVALPEAHKKEGLKHSLEDKLKKFLADTAGAAQAEVEKTHGELVEDPDLSREAQDALRDVAGIATQQIKELLQEAQNPEPVAAEAETRTASVTSETPEPKPEEVSDKVEVHDVEGDLAQIDKEIKILQNKIPAIKGREYAQAVQRLEDLTQYEGELAPETSKGEEPMVIERIGDDKASDVAAGRKTPDAELELSPDESVAAEKLKLNWDEPLKYEQEQLELVLQMMKAGQESMETFKEAHVNSAGLTPIEQQYVWMLETDQNCYKAKGEFIENSIAGMTAQKALQDLEPSPENAEAIGQAKASLEKAIQNKEVLAAALVAATLAMQEARGSYTHLLKEVGVNVEDGLQGDDAQAEIDRAEEWSFGHAFDSDDRHLGSGFESNGSMSKEVITLQGGHGEGQKEPGVLQKAWKGVAGWLKKFFG